MRELLSDPPAELLRRFGPRAAGGGGSQTRIVEGAGQTADYMETVTVAPGRENGYMVLLVSVSAPLPTPSSARTYFGRVAPGLYRRGLRWLLPVQKIARVSRGTAPRARTPKSGAPED